jgi:murein DD-endopeptidase MepM/ murein hydrolase activator NlpD
MPRLRSRALALAVVILATGSAAYAQTNDPLPTLPTTTSSTTTSTTSTSTTTTTTAPRRSTTTTSTTRPPAPPPTTPPTGPATDPTVVTPPGGGDAPGSGPVPPAAQEAIKSIKRSPANDTRRLLAALRPLVDLGMPEGEAVQVGFGRFPVGGEATFSHDWWFPRHVPTFHLHEGTDIFAAAGTPVRAPADGVIKHVDTAIGGLCVYVYEPNGTYYYLAHLSAFAPGQVTGQAVKQGEVVGYVGTSGNAVGTPPHLHFEVHPAPTDVVTTGRGRRATTTVVQRSVPIGTQLSPVDPKPLLDQWLEEAITAAPRLIAAYEAGRPRAIIATGLTRRLADGSGGVFAAPSAPPRAQLLWAAAAGPSGGALRLAEAEAAAAAGEVDYAALAAAEQERIRRWQVEDAYARAVLTPLTPAPLRKLLYR